MENEIKLKKCSHCGTEKPSTDYYSGASICKPCKAEKANLWRLSNQERFQSLPSRSAEKGREYSRKSYYKKKQK